MVRMQSITIPVLVICCLFLTTVSKADELTTIDIVPGQVKLMPGETCRFVAQGYDRYYKETSFTPKWHASGGVINQEGVFQAGQEPGVYFITAFDRVSGREGTAVVTIQQQQAIQDNRIDQKRPDQESTNQEMPEEMPDQR